jgi:hypothetical protein
VGRSLGLLRRVDNVQVIARPNNLLEVLCDLMRCRVESGVPAPKAGKIGDIQYIKGRT